MPTGPFRVGRTSTLVVEAGTTIFSTGNLKAIEVAGRFEVLGSEEAPVVIENVQIGAAPFDGFTVAPSAFVFRHARLWGSPIGTSFAQVHQNSFLTTDRVVTSGCFDVTNNYWGGVADGDVPSLLGCPSGPYLPTLAAPHPDTPDITPWLP